MSQTFLPLVCCPRVFLTSTCGVGFRALQLEEHKQLARCARVFPMSALQCAGYIIYTDCCCPHPRFWAVAPLCDGIVVARSNKL
jgi:hypothetical protein